VNRYDLLLAVLVVGSVGTAAHHPPGAALVSAVAARRSGIAMAVFTAGGSVGYGLGALVSAGLVASLGPWSTVLTMPVGLAAIAFLVAAMPRSMEPPRAPQSATPTGRQHWVAGLAILYLVVMLRASAATMFTTFVPILFERRGEHLLLGGFMVFGFTMAGAASGLLGSALADRIGRRALTVTSLALGAPALYLFLHTTGAAQIVLLFACGASILSALPVNIVMAQRLLPRHASTVSGVVMGLAWGIGGLAATGLGALADHWALAMGEVNGLARAMDLIPLVPLAGAVLALALPGSDMDPIELSPSSVGESA
jgi:FSR family fosmidomycin resistance protein-like MFS transporter